MAVAVSEIMMQLKVKRLNPAAVLPAYARAGDAGLDLFAARPATLAPGASALVPTGIAIELPPGTEAQVRPRSGLALKHAITLPNSPATIDPGYRGEIRVILLNLGREPYIIHTGDRIAQMVIVPVVQAQFRRVESFDTSARGTGGFGSTGPA